MKRLCLTFIASLVAYQAHGVVVSVNGGFEGSTAISTAPPAYPGANPGTLGTGPPTTTGVWGGDPSQVVTASSVGNSWNAGASQTFGPAIGPRTGFNMLEFVGTSSSDLLYSTDSEGPGGALDTNTGSDIFQIIDLSPYDANIAAGTAQIDASAWFASGDFDTEFQVNLLFFDDASGFNTATDVANNLPAFDAIQSNSSFLYGGAFNFLTSAPDPTDPWRQISIAPSLIPTSMDWAVIQLKAIENFNNGDTRGFEFQANFADDVVVNIDPGGPVIPEPARAALFLLGGFAMVARRRRK